MWFISADIKSISNLVAAKVNFEKGTMDVIGVSSAVRSARLMIATQVLQEEPSTTNTIVFNNFCSIF